MKTAGKALFPNIDFPFVFLLILLIISATHPCAAKLKTPSNTVVATIQVGPSPGALVCSPDGRFVYVNCADEIAIIDTTSFQVIATVAMPYGHVVLSCDLARWSEPLYGLSDGF